MKKLALLLVPCVMLFCCDAFAAPITDPWLDEVISFSQPSGSSPAKNDPSDALGAFDGQVVSIDIPEVLILAFTNNSAFDGAGNDLEIRELGGDASHCYVDGSKDGVSWTRLIEAAGTHGAGTTSIYVDLAGTGLDFLNYLRFVGKDNKGSAPGFDLDGVQAINSGAPVPIPGAVWLLGSGLIGLVGFRRKFRNR
jgi:hypothetical protein